MPRSSTVAPLLKFALATNHHHMVTHAKSSIQCPKERSDGTVRYPLPSILIAMVSFSPMEPTSYTQAVRSPEEWVALIGD